MVGYKGWDVDRYFNGLVGQMLETIYLGIGTVAAIAMFFEDRSSPFLIRITLSMLVCFAWPYFVVAILIRAYLNKK